MIISNDIVDELFTSYFDSGNVSHSVFSLPVPNVEEYSVPELININSTFQYIILEHGDIPTGLPMLIVGKDADSGVIFLYPKTFKWYRYYGKFYFIW